MLPVRRASRFCLLIALLLAGAQVPAGEDGSRLVLLEPVVVTATRSAREQVDAPVRVELVPREEIERSHARTLTGALENVPGLHLREIHGKPGSQANLQGFNGDQVLVLVDGLPVSASTGSTVDVSQVALTEVERVEIVKGATSAQYGSAAMGGVINVISRDIRPGLAGEWRVDAGTHGDQNPSGDPVHANSRHARFLLEGGSSRLRGRFAASHNGTDGISPDPQSWARPGDEVSRSQVDGRVEWHPSAAGRIYLQAGHFEQQGASRYTLALPGGGVDQQKDEDVRRSRFTGGGHWQFGNDAVVRLSALDEVFRNDTIKQAEGDTFDDRRAELHLEQLSVQLDLPPGQRHLLQLGGDLRRDRLAQSKDNDSELTEDHVSRHSSELYLQHTHFPSATVELLAGARYQDDSDFGGHLAGKAGLRWHTYQGRHWRMTLRAGWGQGYRVPNLKERFFLFDHSQFGYVVIGNPSLQPEESESSQLGVTLRRGRAFQLEQNLYFNALRNLIQIDADNAAVVDGVQQFRYANIGRARTWGLETALRWHAHPRLLLEAGYTWLNAENLDDRSELTRRPEHQGRFGLTLNTTQRSEFSLRARYQSSELVNTQSDARSPAWTELDLRLNYDSTPSLRFFAGIDNLLNAQKDFSDPNDFRPVRGTHFYLGVRHRFGHDTNQHNPQGD